MTTPAPDRPSLARRWWAVVARRVGEVAIVTLGILIAFALDAWWDNHNVAEQEQVHLRALASDLERNVAALGKQITMEESIVASSEKLVKMAREGTQDGTLAVDLVNRVFNSGRYEPVMGAYEALVNSGGLTLIHDEDLRAALAGFAASVRGQYAESWTDQHYFAFAREYAGRISLLHLQKADDATKQREILALLAERKFIEHLSLRYFSERDISQKYRDLLNQAEALLARIRAEIND
jgi:hypothetical protein